MACYTLGIHLYGLALRVAAWFHPKARKWVKGRQNWVEQHRELSAALPENRPLFWFHCASLGEFEQGRPLIEKLKARNRPPLILLTFYSPSGYEIRQKYPQADVVAYLPLDTPAQARAFVAIWQPQLAIFVKYEFWFNVLRQLQKQHVPTLLISGLFRPGQLFFKPYGKPFRRALEGFSHLFVQNEASGQVLSGAGIHQYTVAGDTRIDRVQSIAQQAPEIPAAATFCQSAPVLIAGSSWPEDEACLLPFLNTEFPTDWKAIIAPHEISESNLRNIEQQLSLPCIRYSKAENNPEQLAAARVLLIDNIGMLSALYQYGRIAYIGGGFKTGLHNTLEPIAFGLPVLFGPYYHKFEEARYLVREGGGFVITQKDDLFRTFQQLQHPEAYTAAAAKALSYIKQNQGATQKVLNWIESASL
ncbi:3-deoxy-D-manno-octulosonic acid transferase [Phaeodactylibacter xiamenensis]|uniref:3-deoxy-D-manno-octulosonic acid transferase n=1 Tax=Phaeodactylibacter xiamenensis TaxID=1524460 RepID=UPI003CCC3771